jgi:hypothetical protein
VNRCPEFLFSVVMGYDLSHVLKLQNFAGCKSFFTTDDLLRLLFLFTLFFDIKYWEYRELMPFLLKAEECEIFL